LPGVGTGAQLRIIKTPANGSTTQELFDDAGRIAQFGKQAQRKLIYECALIEPL
jgi:hypothetical protein